VYPQYPRHWLSASHALYMKEFFGVVSREIALRLDHNSHADERGLTDELVRLLTDRKSDLITKLQAKLKDQETERFSPLVDSGSPDAGGTRLQLTLHETSISEEASIGADIGIVVRVATDDLQFERSVLFQSKRLQATDDAFSPFCSYGLDSRRARRQAETMSRHNSASFFVLFNPVRFLSFDIQNDQQNPELIEIMARLASRWNAEYANLRSCEFTVMPAATDLLARVIASQFDPSAVLSVLPAGFVIEARPSALRAKPISRYVTSFADFMVDGVIRGNIGDSTEQGKNVAAGRNRQFHVRYSIGIDVRAGRFFSGESLAPLFS
jgi:hypothetical protein